MRPGEMLGLLAGDCYTPRANSELPLVLAIRDPKNKAHMGRAQFRLVHDSGSIAWIRWLIRDLPAETPLWGASANIFRRYWDWALGELLLNNLSFLEKTS